MSEPQQADNPSLIDDDELEEFVSSPDDTIDLGAVEDFAPFDDDEDY
ncbi:hypothetical protein [Catellatospora sichuanensis]|nr:hypothetical protein [Catellatospora sichuanensis]